MAARTIFLLGLLGFAIASWAQEEVESSRSESKQSEPSEAPAGQWPVESEVVQIERDADSPIRTTMILTRAGSIAGLHEVLQISPNGKVDGIWMGTSYDTELKTDQIEKIGSALDTSALFKVRTLPRPPIGSDLIWVSIRYEGTMAIWDELLASDKAEKLIDEIAGVLRMNE